MTCLKIKLKVLFYQFSSQLINIIHKGGFNMIDKFSHGFINSVYDFNDFTLNELICKLAQKMDEVITQSNEIFNYLDWLKGQGLSD